MSFLYRWLPQALIISALCLLVYAAVQQNYRQSFNDPQIRLAEDTKLAIDGGKSWESVVPTTQIEVASLSPWIAITDGKGNVLTDYKPPAQSIEDITAIATTLATEGGPVSSLAIPAQSFAVARTDEENKITWQSDQLAKDRLPYQPREAIVIVPLMNGDYVVAGRNMREVERHEQSLFDMVAIVWAFLMLATLLWELFALRWLRLVRPGTDSSR